MREGGKAKAAPLGLQAGERLPLGAGTCAALRQSPGKARKFPQVSWVAEDRGVDSPRGPPRDLPHHRTGGARRSRPGTGREARRVPERLFLGV